MPSVACTASRASPSSETSSERPVEMLAPARMSAPSTSSDCGARELRSSPLTYIAVLSAISARKPVVDALARLFAVAVWRAIAPRNAVSEV